MCVAILGLLGLGCGSSGSCADACAKASALNCKGGTTQAQCEQECNNPVVFPGCAAQSAAALDCAKKASSFVCSSDGSGAKAVGCDAQEAALTACASRVFGDAGFVDQD
jgi:hypothetical protein